jgi:hypothetical protein
MYLEWEYFENEANAIIDRVGVDYRKISSGWEKGKYNAQLHKSKSDEDKDFREYNLSKFGDANFPTTNRYADYTKEGALKSLKGAIANFLSKKEKGRNPQYYSDLYKYYLKKKESKNKDIYFKSTIGYSSIDYFNIINGVINEDNWERKILYEGAIQESFNTITKFKELYYSVKEKAKLEWLKNNISYSFDERKPLTTFKFDEENIPAIKDFESRFNEVVKPEISSTSIDILKKLNLSKLANTGNVKVGYRKEFLNGNIALGRERELVFPNDEVHKSYFAVVELFDILASHNEVTFGNTKEYPTDSNGKNVNDRNYTGDKNAQAKVVSVAQKLNPNIIVSTSATASGTPVITIDGIVVSGNNRTMSLKLATTNYAENYENYKKVLFAELESGGYGISMSQVFTNFKQPVLVRFDIDFASYTSTELNAFNKPRSKSEKNIDRAIRLSKQIKENEGCQNALIELVSEQEIVSELYNDRSSVNRFKKLLIDCNIISENEVSAFFSDFSLTETGKILYETLLVSLVLNPTAIEISQNAGVKSATNSIVNAIIPLVKNRKFEEGSIVEEVNNALLIQNSMVSNDYKKLSEYITENTIFKEDQSHKTEKALIINWYLNQRVNDFKSAMLKFNNSLESNAGGSLFGDSLSPDEIFNSIFTSNVDSDVTKAIGTYNKHQDPIVVATTKYAPTTSSDKAKEILISRLQKASKYL